MPDIDGVIVVAKVGGTRREGARRLNSLLARLNAPILGVVLSAVPRSESGQPYYAQLRSIPGNAPTVRR